MKGIYASPTRLNILSCAVAGRPGRSAYEAAAEAGYTGTAAEYNAILGSLPAALTRLNQYNGRVDAILEYLENRVTDLELAVAALQQAANQSAAAPLRREASPDASAPALQSVAPAICRPGPRREASPDASAPAGGAL